MDTQIGTLYEAINVWRRADDQTLACYRCFRDLRSGRYAVQSADFYPAAFDGVRTQFLEKQYLDLLRAQDPFEREQGFDSLEDAIRAHDLQFESRE